MTLHSTAAFDSPARDGSLALESPPTASSARFAWVELIPWGIMFGVGWLIVELTAKPTIGIAVACLKFGWKDAAIAWWLYRSDPWPDRGRTHAVWFLSKAAMRYGVATLVIAILIGLAGGAIPEQPDFERWTVTLSGGLSGLVASACFGVAAVLGSLTLKTTPVWLDSSIDATRRQRAWPPRPSREDLGRSLFRSSRRRLVLQTESGRGNGALWIVAWSAAVPLVFTALLVFQATRSSSFAAVASLTIGSIWATVASRFVALSPSLAWPELLLMPELEDAGRLDRFHLRPEDPSQDHGLGDSLDDDEAPFEEDGEGDGDVHLEDDRSDAHRDGLRRTNDGVRRAERPA